MGVRVFEVQRMNSTNKENNTEVLELSPPFVCIVLLVDFPKDFEIRNSLRELHPLHTIFFCTENPKKLSFLLSLLTSLPVVVI